MATKRKSEQFEALVDASVSAQKATNQAILDRPTKKARVASGSGTSNASGSNGKDTPKLTWQDIKLEGEDEGEVPIYDDCGEVRRKIRLLQKTPGWKVTQWLKDIGKINNNSYGRFMREKGRTDGAANGTYYAAYVYFEKVRILENKKKSAKRLEVESMFPNGYLRENQRYVWAPS